MKIAAALAFATLLSKSEAFVSPAAFGAKARSVTSLAVSQSDLDGAQAMIDDIINEKNCNPFFVRLAWHDSGTHDVNVKGDWPAAGGAIGSIRFDPEINHGANAGLSGALTLLGPVKEKYPDVSYADIFQMASARGIELAGGPKIDMKYGRVDATSAEQCSPEGNLPDAEAGDEGLYGGCKEMEDKTAAGHLRKVFYRMGLGDEEIVALSGAHTFGTLRRQLLLSHRKVASFSSSLTFACCNSHLNRTCLQGPLWPWCRKDKVYGWQQAGSCRWKGCDVQAWRFTLDRAVACV